MERWTWWDGFKLGGAIALTMWCGLMVILLPLAVVNILFGQQLLALGQQLLALVPGGRAPLALLICVLYVVGCFYLARWSLRYSDRTIEARAASTRT